VLILLSSLSFTGSLSDTESKIIDKTEAPATTPAAPAQGTTPAPAAPATK
jgi:preprotein translocase subunit SecG